MTVFLPSAALKKPAASQMVTTCCLAHMRTAGSLLFVVVAIVVSGVFLSLCTLTSTVATLANLLDLAAVDLYFFSRVFFSANI